MMPMQQEQYNDPNMMPYYGDAMNMSPMDLYDSIFWGKLYWERRNRTHADMFL